MTHNPYRASRTTRRHSTLPSAALVSTTIAPPGTALTLEFGPDQSFDAEARWSTGNRVGVQFAVAVDTDALIGQRIAASARGRIRRAA